MIGVLGGGAWGLALAQLCASKGLETRVWARGATTVAAINAHASPALPDVTLDGRLTASSDPATLKDADIVLSVIPAQAARGVLAAVSPLLKSGSTLVLTGPSFAIDVARGLPTAVTIAAQNMADAIALRDVLATPTFRPYPSDDMVGAQVGGAVKNVLAIACGIIVARKLGESARAALIARGYAEMNRLAQAMGGSAAGVVALGRNLQVEMPISETVAAIVAGDLDVSDAVSALLQRPLAERE
jgi:glycerol-3-phosphate dehydrogenase (NAD(P)+)